MGPRFEHILKVYLQFYRLQAKQARAERQRLEYQTERAKKIHQLLARVEEVKVTLIECS